MCKINEMTNGNGFIGSESEEIKKGNKRPSLSRAMYPLRDTQLASFDIFDTLLFRPFADPKDLFYILGEKFEEMDFYNLRIRCEREARDLKEENIGNREITIYDIYERIHYYTDIDIAYGVKTEYELEMDLIYPNEYQKYMLETFLNNHIPVVLTSDMYYPKEMLEKILAKNNISGYQEIYVSCDRQCSKGDGSLFNCIINDYSKVPSDKITHIDDNWNVILKAREAGLKGIHYIRNEALTKKYRPSYMSAMVGSAYQGVVNKYLAANEVKFSVPYEYGFTYGGILAFGYCSFIHKSCIERGIHKVLFMSRDGDILKQVWDFLYNDIPSGYILISRACVRRLSVVVWKKMFLECAVDRLSTNKRTVTIEQALEQCELMCLADKLKDYNLSVGMLLSQRQNAVIVSRYRDFIESHMAEIRNEYEDSNKIYDQYLKSLLSEDDVKVALVDIGWRGVNGTTLEKTIKKTFPNLEVINFIVGGRQPVNLPQIRNENILCYLFSAEKNYGILARHKETSNFFYELLTMSTTASFEHFYYDNEGRVRMKCGDVIPGNYLKAAEIQQGILDFVKEYAKHFMNYKGFYDIPPDDVAQVLYNIMNSEEYFKKYFSDICYSPQLDSEINTKFTDWI